MCRWVACKYAVLLCTKTKQNGENYRSYDNFFTSLRCVWIFYELSKVYKYIDNNARFQSLKIKFFLWFLTFLTNFREKNFKLRYWPNLSKLWKTCYWTIHSLKYLFIHLFDKWLCFYAWEGNEKCREIFCVERCVSLFYTYRLVDK